MQARMQARTCAHLCVCARTSMRSVCAALTQPAVGTGSGRFPMRGMSHQPPSAGGPALKVAACRDACDASEPSTVFLPVLGPMSLACVHACSRQQGADSKRMCTHAHSFLRITACRCMLGVCTRALTCCRSTRLHWRPPPGCQCRRAAAAARAAAARQTGRRHDLVMGLAPSPCPWQGRC